jgi:hypothetical protein
LTSTTRKAANAPGNAGSQRSGSEPPCTLCETG